MSKKKLVKAAVVITAVTILSKVMGFVRDALIASSFGASFQTDAYMMSLIVPNILFNLFGLAVTTTFIPLLSESLSHNGKEDMFDFANSVMNFMIVVSLVLFVIGWIFTPNLVTLIAPNYTGEVYNLTVELTKISILNIIFLSLNSGFMAILQSQDSFLAPALVGFIMDLPIVLYLMFGAKYGVVGLTIATVIGFGLQILVQVPWLIRNGYRYKIYINFKDPRLIKMLTLIAPVLIGIGINQINTLVDRIMASGLPLGSVSSLEFANRVSAIVYYLFASTIVMVIYPTLSRSSLSDDFTQFRKYVSKGINNINMFMIPSCLAIIILRRPIINILFMHGRFDEKAATMSSYALLFFSIGMIFLGIRDILNRAFYSLQDTKTPMINGAFGVIVNIVSNLILVRFLGIGGLALSTSLSIALCSVLLLKDLRKRIGGINGDKIIVSTGKITVASIIMAVVLYFLNNILSTRLIGFKGQVMSIFIFIIIGILVYGALLKFFRLDEFNELLDFIFIKFKRKNPNQEKR